MTGLSLDRRAVVARLLQERGDTVVITGLGSPTYDVAAAGDDDRNFYLWGAMGGAAMVGLGLALARPELPVLVVTGDGEMLMGMGSLATIALQAPPNLVIAVLDNGLYGETGGQESHTAAGTDLAGVARSCGIADVRVIEDMENVGLLAAHLLDVTAGPRFAVIRIARAEPERVLPPRDAAVLRARTRAALGLSPGP
ncbi:thiamine pyrophosphate-dependent enzyme [Roseomonas chloroacetimidivorans]|jgi:thiamine pyrophosphate-dependent acetolactate synthase large subunit-like protein|uniref:thiamine pyrophosphate-dependent enzyme n=1 Tax=Roseomonas chloroacetimidivorans TaxID=1766656 RepID=UPI003C7420AC